MIKKDKSVVDDGLKNYEFSEEDINCFKQIPEDLYVIRVKNTKISMRMDNRPIATIHMEIQKGPFKGRVLKKVNLLKGKPLYHFSKELKVLGKTCDTFKDLEKSLESMVGMVFTVKVTCPGEYTNVTVASLL